MTDRQTDASDLINCPMLAMEQIKKLSDVSYALDFVDICELIPCVL